MIKIRRLLLLREWWSSVLLLQQWWCGRVVCAEQRRRATSSSDGSQLTAGYTHTRHTVYLIAHFPTQLGNSRRRRTGFFIFFSIIHATSFTHPLLFFCSFYPGIFLNNIKSHFFFSLNKWRAISLFRERKTKMTNLEIHHQVQHTWPTPVSRLLNNFLFFVLFFKFCSSQLTHPLYFSDFVE